MSENWTIRRVLDWTSVDFDKRGLDSPRLTSELLMAHALGCDRVALYLDLDRPLGAEELREVKALIARRRAREPVAYIVGSRGFYGRSFAVSPAVLVPRPDTETLVDRALELIPAGPESAGTSVLDLCTGSGILAITLAAERCELEATATDLSPEALAVARQNAEANGVEGRCRFLEGDLFGALMEPTRYALIVCNPPYIRQNDLTSLQPEIAEHEPMMALDGGEDGLDFYRRLVAEAAGRLEPGGHLLLEVGAGQAEEVLGLLEASPGLEAVGRHVDLGGIERVVEGRRVSSEGGSA